MYNCLRMLKTLFNTAYERHAFVVGFGEAFAFRRPLIGLDLYCLKQYQVEYHYYQFGRAIGALAWAGIAIGMIEIWR